MYQRPPGRPCEGNFEIPQMLITNEIGYKIINEDDKDKLKQPTKVEQPKEKDANDLKE